MGQGSLAVLYLYRSSEPILYVQWFIQLIGLVGRHLITLVH